MQCTIRAVESASDLKRFIKSQWNFYKGDPYFVPPVIMDREKLLNTKKNPFYQHSKMQLFLAEADGEVVGRIGAIINDNHNIEHEDKVGFFGFFECIDDQQVANDLLDTAATWLRERGMKQIRGPVNPSMNDESGLLIEGFDSPPQILMTYNPRYYQTLIEKNGHAKVMDIFAYELRNESYASEKMQRVVSLLRQRTGVTIRAMDFSNKRAFLRDANSIKHIINASWVKNWGFVKFTDAEFDFLVADLKQIAEPSLVLLAEHEGKPVGFSITLPNINEVLIHNKNGGILGALWHLLTKKKKIRSVRIIVLGLLPEFRNKGIDVILYAETADAAHKLGCDIGEASWILENNEPMNRALTQTMQARKYKTYRIFEKEL